MSAAEVTWVVEIENVDKEGAVGCKMQNAVLGIPGEGTMCVLCRQYGWCRGVCREDYSVLRGRYRRVAAGGCTVLGLCCVYLFFA